MTGIASEARARLLQRRKALQTAVAAGNASACGEVARELDDIDAALDRIQQGAYGRCEICQGAIGRQRLLALPAARLCIDCTAARIHAGF